MKVLFSVFLTSLCLSLSAQFPKTLASSELYHELEKLSSTANILYLAAHPDDENTRLISYFENELHVRTAYLSLTRGAGGQNLIGTEIGPAIGVLRTQELLAARRIDGGEQFFTRAVDFGYSKSAEESFEKWEKAKVLADVVWVIRKFRPDVIVTRFPPTNYAGHGHHEASAILAEEAFDLAADPSAFPEQLEYVDPWQPKRLYFNASTWWIKDLEERAKDSEDYLRIDIGSYNPLLGLSYAQIAAMSRSQHRSQGFGSDFPYGTQMEYLQFVKGSKASQESGLLEGIKNGWEANGLGQVGEILQSALNTYDFSDPVKSVEALISAGKILQKEKSSPFVDHKLDELNKLLLNLMGVSIELISDSKFAVRGSEIPARLNANNPSEIAFQIIGYDEKRIDATVKNNELYSTEIFLGITNDRELSNPYWLKSDYTTLYHVDDYEILGTAENGPALSINADLEINGYAFTKEIPAKHKEVDPAKAVIYTPVYVVPEVSLSFSENVVITAPDQTKSVFITATCYAETFEGEVAPELPKGWTVEPSSINLKMEGQGDSELLEFKITAGKSAKRGEAKLKLAGAYAKTVQTISYEHIPTQIIISDSEVSLVPINLDKGKVELVGYIEGPGDDVGKYLRAAGYDVRELSTGDLQGGDLSQFDAIITGIRAFNTREDLSFANSSLNGYVSKGGVWIVQYNTSRGLKSEGIGPYPFEITRERVTDEKAVAKFLVPEHPVMNTPNKITEADFDNWVQERGLYFAAGYEGNFTPLLSWNDPTEPPREGGLIVAPYGDGYFIYTGISFFRQLPAGVVGSYRLLANMLALGDLKSSND